MRLLWKILLRWCKNLGINQKVCDYFRIEQTKCAIIIFERDYVKLVQDGLQRPLKKYFLGTKLANLYHLSSDMAIYKRAMTISTSTRINVHKKPHYREMAEILA